MKAARVGLMLSALSSCNGLTGIYDLSPGEGLGGSGDDAVASGGRPRAAGGSVASGGRKSASGGSVESSGGERSSGGAQEGSGGTREGAGGAREGGGGSGGDGGPEPTGGTPGAGGSAPSGGSENVGGSSGGQEATGGAAAGGSSGGSESVGGSGGHPVGSLPLLDDFSTALDSRWKSPFGFRIEDGALKCDECTSAILWNETFSLPQAVSVRYTSIASGADEMNLVLLAASATCNLIEVIYGPDHGHMGVSTCQGGGAWQTHGGVIRPLGEGSILEGRARAAPEPDEVIVEIAVNGVVVYETTVPFFHATGSIGVSGRCESPACLGPLEFDDFRGGVLAE